MKIHSILKRILLLAIGFIFNLTLMSQECFKGRVISSDKKQPVAGATIVSEGLAAVQSLPDGKFEICGYQGENLILWVRCLGYEPKTVTVSLKSNPGLTTEIQLEPLIHQIDEVVVVATRTGSSLNHTPVRVNLLSSRQLESSPIQSIDEAIKYVPGINWSRPFGIFSTKAIVSMRGMSGKEQGRVLVLLDGIPLNKSDGGTVDWNLVNVDLVERIEVMKGAGSALYGGNAMGGVINIITRKPSVPFYAKASAEYGSFNTIGGKVMAGGRKLFKKTVSSMFWNASAFYKQSDGYITQSEADIRANPYIIKSDMMEFGTNVKAGISIHEDHFITARLNYYNDHRGTGEKVFQPDGNVTDHDSYGITLDYKGQVGKWSMNASVYDLTENYIKVNEYLKDDYTWYDVLSVRQDIGSIATVTRSFGDHHRMTGGFDFRRGSVDAYDKYFTSTDIVYNEGKMNTYALYLQDEVKLIQEKLRLVAGFRYDVAKFFDGSFRIENLSLETTFMKDYQEPDMLVKHWNALSPRFSAQYSFRGGNRVYAMVSKGFRPSVLDDLCRSGRIRGGFKIANPALMPEYLTNYEIGFDLIPYRNLVVNASAYYSRGKDFQYYVSTGQTIDMGFGDRPIFKRANISDAKIRGFEFETRYELGEMLTLSASYAFNSSMIMEYRRIDQNDTIDLTGNYFTDVPGHLLTLGANLRHKWVNASCWLHYTGEMFINDQNIKDEILKSNTYPAFTTVDVRIWRSFGERYNFAFNIQNLFDVKYYDSKYAVCPGRFVTAEFIYRFETAPKRNETSNLKSVRPGG
jgi:iron complex outermembrane receptor protein